MLTNGGNISPLPIRAAPYAAYFPANSYFYIQSSFELFLFVQILGAHVNNCYLHADALHQIEVRTPPNVPTAVTRLRIVLRSIVLLVKRPLSARCAAAALNSEHVHTFSYTDAQSASHNISIATYLQLPIYTHSGCRKLPAR